MKYTTENVQKIVASYNLGATPEEIALEYDVPPRSIIAKLASLGVYKRKEYLTKRGEVPVKKSLISTIRGFFIRVLGCASLMPTA